MKCRIIEVIELKFKLQKRKYKHAHGKRFRHDVMELILAIGKGAKKRKWSIKSALWFVSYFCYLVYSQILDAVAEILTFGALKKCPACEGQLVFIKTGYICTGNASEWVKCVYFTKIPARMPSAIPPELTNFFAGKKIGLQTRALRKVEWGPTNNSSYDKDRFILYVPMSGFHLIHSNLKTHNYRPKVERQKPPLYLMEIVILGNLSVSHSVMEPIIKKMGGQLVSHIHCKTAAIISTEEEIAKMDERMQLAKNLGIQVVPEKFLEEVQDGGAVEYIAKYSISDWGSDVII